MISYQNNLIISYSPKGGVFARTGNFSSHACGAFLWEDIMEIITREEAKTKKLKRYFTGKPCVQGHVSERYTRNNYCIECSIEYYQLNKERIRQHNFENREYRNEYGKRYHAENKESRAIINKQWRLKNKEHLARYMRKWQLENAESLAEYNHNWRNNNHEAVRTRERLYSQTPEGKIINKRTCLRRHRNLGFNPLNKKFKGSVGHHINQDDVVYIPREIHLRHYHGTYTEQHRKEILDFYGSLENMLNNFVPLPNEIIDEEND